MAYVIKNFLKKVDKQVSGCIPVVVTDWPKFGHFVNAMSLYLSFCLLAILKQQEKQKEKQI